jgi:hypothetical protein
MKKHVREILFGILASLIAAAIVAAVNRATETRSLWFAGLAGFGAGCGVVFLMLVRRLRATVGFVERIEGSTFEFHKLVAEAEKSVFAIGPTLIFLTQKEEIKQLLFQKLSNPKFHVSLLVCDPASATAQLWTEIGYGREFDKAIRESINTFQSWLDKKDRPNLIIKTVGPVTASLVFIDADDGTNGQLLIIPLPWRVSGQNRPCFVISKRFHTSAFNTYYDSYRALFNSDVAKDIENPRQ